jgi:hypothetical protein
MASTYLTRTPASSGSSSVLTYSFWTKRSGLGVLSPFLSGGNTGTVGQIVFSTSDQLNIYNGASVIATTNAKFRDTSAWYHIVISLNSSETGTDKCKIWINGVQETSFATDNRSTFTTISQVNQSGIVQYVGSDTSGYVNGLMSHIHMVDGTAYDASAFGETDATTGIWKPKTAPSVTYGTNGFFLKFENSGTMGTDSSPNANNFTVNGTLTQTVDTPSNVFATFNPLKDGRINAGTQYKATFSNGNTTSTFSEATYNTAAFSTLAVSKGKWYTEIKCSNTGGNTKLGLFSADDYGNNDFSGTYLYDSSGTFGGSAYGDSFTTGDIIQIAFDATNGTLWFGKNGTWQNSATQSEIENGTTTNAAATGIDMTQFWNFGTYGVNGTAFQANFGNGYFGTTAVSSATTDESGLGIFEYTVPSGYYALCTKNINEQEYD